MAQKMGNNTEPTRSCVTPPPKLPQPATIALASRAPPCGAHPELRHDKRGSPNPNEEPNHRQSRVAVLTSPPVRAVGIALTGKTILMGIRGPYLSTKGPSRKCMAIVPLKWQQWTKSKPALLFVSEFLGLPRVPKCDALNLLFCPKA
jgi:hypothetical protein